MKSKALFAGVALVSVMLLAHPVAAQQGEWFVAVRGVSAQMDGESDIVLGTASRLSHDSGFGLGFEWGRMVTDHFSLELALSPSMHDITVEGGLYDGQAAGDEWLLPVTVMARYHFPYLGKLRPSVGLGINYVGFLGFSRGPAATALGVSDLETTGEVGFTARAGLDFELSDTWSGVLDVTYLDIGGETEVTLDRRAWDTVDYEATMWQIGLGVEYRFGYGR